MKLSNEYAKDVTVKSSSQYAKDGDSISRMKAPMIMGFIGLTLIYKVAAYLVENSPMAIPAEEYCPVDNPTCSRPDLFAFQAACFVALAYCGILGFHAWYISKRVHTVIPATPEGRILGYLSESEKLAAASLTFQVWDFVASLFIDEHGTPIMLAHHIIAALVSYASLKSQCAHYYGVFFLGLSELSSLFLVFVSLAKYFPPVPGSWFDLWVAICGPCFAATFLLYRVIMWWKVVYQLWYDVFYILKQRLQKRLQPDQPFVLYMFLVLSIPMGLLQLYWFQIILMEAFKLLSVNSRLNA